MSAASTSTCRQVAGQLRPVQPRPCFPRYHYAPQRAYRAGEARLQRGSRVVTGVASPLRSVEGGHPAPPPAIDARGFLAASHQGELPPADIAAAVSEAARTHGCFQLVNHGVSEGLQALVETEMRTFFAKPKQEKEKIRRTPTNPNGWFDDERTKQIVDIKECFDACHEIIDAQPPTSIVTTQNQWPEGQPTFRGATESWLSEMSRISFKLLEVFSLALDLPLDTLHPLFQDDHTSFLRLNYYPGTQPSTKDLGLNHHTDAGFFTILVQDPQVHGLQYLNPVGEWENVPPLPGALTINVGDQCQVISNDVFKASVHRVLSPHVPQGRFSFPFFFNPRPDAVIAPLDAFVTPDRPAVYRPIPWAGFRQLRYQGDLADVGREVQISDYRI